MNQCRLSVLSLALALGFGVLLAGCVDTTANEPDVFAETQALKRWAVAYNKDLEGQLFSGGVTIAPDNADFKINTNAGAWAALTPDQQDRVFRNALNAVKSTYCFQDDHRGKFIPGLAVRLVDRDGGPDLRYDVTGPGLTCP